MSTTREGPFKAGLVTMLKLGSWLYVPGRSGGEEKGSPTDLRQPWPVALSPYRSPARGIDAPSP